MSGMDGKKGKGLLAAGGALLLALAGAWFGIDGGTGAGNGSPGDAGSGGSGSGAGARPNDGSGTNGGGKTGAGQSRDGAKDGARGDECPIDTLPPQADEVVDRILTNQHHIHSPHDGKHFGNYEGVLPRQKGDYYREYTVETPGLNHRGARRIVVGGGTEDDPDVWYYTDDHYGSFCKIPDAED